MTFLKIRKPKICYNKMGNTSVQRKCPKKQKTMKINSEMYSLQHFTKEQIRDFHEIKRVIIMAWICHLLPSTGILRKCQVSVTKNHYFLPHFTWTGNKEWQEIRMDNINVTNNQSHISLHCT